VSNSAAPPKSPATLYGALLAAVQERGILADGKSFVDAVPLRPAAAILADFTRLPAGDMELAAFVRANFALPPAPERPSGRLPGQDLRGYIRGLWPELARVPQHEAAGSSALPVRHPHVVPGGRFRELYYWDSFFTMLGLLRDGERALAEGLVEAMTDLIETYGYVPNGTRTYYLGRSQPPLYHLMVGLLEGDRPAPRRLAAMKREHAWWMEGLCEAQPGSQVRRVARLTDGGVLNRYWDPADTPREESWREDVETARTSGRLPSEVYRELRAGAESGWDFSSRWLTDGALGSIRTTTVAPIDLNAFLYSLERAIAAASEGEDVERYGDLALARKRAVEMHLWHPEAGCFVDYELQRGARRPQATAAAAAPLLVGLASQVQADATARCIEAQLLASGGLRTTLVDSGQQWDRPNGWAPLQWIAVAGLRRYGHDALAGEIAKRWVTTVATTFERTGLLHEKYDVETGTVGGGGEYALQHGFGWTNGVTADFIDTYRLAP